ncbi:hypothetical protein BH10PSE19_BH10PSE19_02930 [soil metagenome]
METHAAAINSAKLLLVEDETIIQIVMKAMLEKLDCKFDLAKTGKEAIEKANATKYNLILMDIGLPDMRGTEVARDIKGSMMNKDTAIIAVTGFSISDVETECKAAGIIAVYNKPVDLNKLKIIVNIK